MRMSEKVPAHIDGPADSGHGAGAGYRKPDREESGAHWARAAFGRKKIPWPAERPPIISLTEHSRVTEDVPARLPQRVTMSVEFIHKVAGCFFASVWILAVLLSLWLPRMKHLRRSANGE
jgi:hypothetical protein